MIQDLSNEVSDSLTVSVRLTYVRPPFKRDLMLLHPVIPYGRPAEGTLEYGRRRLS